MIDVSKITPDPDWPDKDYYPFYYKGHRAEQNPNIFKALDVFAKRVKPNTIIEIGSRRGGFTKILEDHPLSDNALIYSFDIQEFITEGEAFTNKVKRKLGDCFQLEEFIAKLINQKGISIVFCDGGNKNREINVFAKHLKMGDYILGHDYAPNEIIWRKDFLGKKWDWFETWDSAIKHTEEKYNLQHTFKKVFGDVVWKCLVKK